MRCRSGKNAKSKMCRYKCVRSHNLHEQENYICLEGGFRDYSSSTVVWGFSQIPLLGDHDIMTKLYKLKLDEMMHSCVSWRHTMGIFINVSLLIERKYYYTHF